MPTTEVDEVSKPGLSICPTRRALPAGRPATGKAGKVIICGGAHGGAPTALPEASRQQPARTE
jgi:hypothetical protein